MIEPTYFTLTDVESALAIGRDTLCRCAAAGLLRFDGENKQRRVVASSYYALKRRIDEEGVTLWQLLNDAEQRPSEAKPTDADQSTKTATESGGSSRRRKTKSDKAESAIPTKPAPPWLKVIT